MVEAPITTMGGSGVASYALDPADAERLWEISELAASVRARSCGCSGSAAIAAARDATSR